MKEFCSKFLQIICASSKYSLIKCCIVVFFSRNYKYIGNHLPVSLKKFTPPFHEAYVPLRSIGILPSPFSIEDYLVLSYPELLIKYEETNEDLS